MLFLHFTYLYYTYYAYYDLIDMHLIEINIIVNQHQDPAGGSKKLNGGFLL